MILLWFREFFLILGLMKNSKTLDKLTDYEWKNFCGKNIRS